MSEHIPVITIDGPSGTGKGTICRQLAKQLGWHMLDSGALYRLLALAVNKSSIALDSPNDIATLAKNLDVRFLDEGGVMRIYLNGHDETEAIRTEQCGQTASKIAVYPVVREALLAWQRNVVQSPGLVADGRDMGTVVFPNADLKIFLDASDNERARRRFEQLQASGNSVSLAQVVSEMQQRDARDSQRTHAPLKMAQDAIKVDTTGLTIAQVLEVVLQLVAKQLPLMVG